MNGSVKCEGVVDPEAEVCDGKDNDCDGTSDNDCAEPDFPRGGTSGGGGPGGGGLGGGFRGSGSCGGEPDNAGAPVSMTTGNMSVGPLELVSLATPTGMPLRLAITYNSRNLLVGALGIGWTLNTEQRVSLPAVGSAAPPTYWSEVGTNSRFPLPSAPAADERSALLPDATLFTRSQGGANLGFYFAAATSTFCPNPSQCAATQLEPRVAFEDGSTALFTTSGAFAGMRDLAGNEQRYFFPAPGLPATIPTKTGLSQGSRRVELHRYSASRTDVIATVGSTETTVASVLLDGAGYLTDICVPIAPLSTPSCASAACGAAGMRSLYRFQYITVTGAAGPMRLSEVTDEDCKTVERHQYGWKAGLGVVATTSESPTESLSFDFVASPLPGASTRTSSVEVVSALAPLVRPTGSQQAQNVSSTRFINAAVNRVASVGETCGCGSSIARAWDTHPLDNVVPVIAQLRQGLTTSFFTYGSGVLDPYRFGRSTGERQRDEHPGVWGVSLDRVLTFAYQHPLVRRPTITTQPGNSGVKVSVSDYDDDHPIYRCREGVPRGAGSPPSPTMRRRVSCAESLMASE